MDFAEILMRSYLLPQWKTVPLCPFPLSDVYTTLDMEFCEGYNSRPLQHYAELFGDINVQAPVGPRILVQADSGMGKTMFTHKLALDWAEKRFTEFDLLLIVKLGHLAPDVALSQAIVNQMQLEEELSPQDVEKHLIRPDKKVLLILDGLDEVDLTKYSQLTRILSRKDYPRCCVFATCKPHVVQQVRHYMTRTVRITGFSKSSAQKFVSFIIPDENKRYQFFMDLIERNMYEMYKIPRILLVLVCMYDSGKLWNTYTRVYEDLLLNLRKACEGNKKLSDAEIDEAMNTINEMAFQSLIQSTKQLVLPTEKIVNENIFKLGILSGTDFLHTTLREFSTAGHITRQLGNGNRAPWEMIKAMYVQKLKDTSKSSFQIPLRRDGIDMESLTSATEKFVNNIMINENGQVVTIRKLLKVVVSKGFLDEDAVDREKLQKICSLIPELESFTDKEKKTAVHFLAEFLSKLNREQKQKYTEMIINFLAGDGTSVTYRWVVSDIRTRLKKPRRFTQTMMAITQQIVSSGEEFTVQSVNKELLWLQHQANSMKSLFRFIMGKLSGSDMAADVLDEIAELLVTNAVDQDNGQVLSVSFLKHYIQHLMQEAGMSSNTPNSAIHASDTCTTHNTSTDVAIPAVISIKGPMPEFRQSGVRSTALKLEDVAGCLSRSVKLIDSIRYLTVVELCRIKGPDSRMVEQLAESLRYRTIVSVHMEELDKGLSKAVVRTLSPTALRLSLKQIPKTSDYWLPTEVDLKNLYIEQSLSGLSKMFRSTFYELKSLSIVSKFTWSESDLGSIHAVVLKGRMPQLEILAINHGSLRNRLQYILDMMEANTCQISTTDLEDTSLSTYDGKLLLEALRQRKIKTGSLCIYHETWIFNH